MNQEKIGKFIAKRRKEKKLTQEEVAFGICSTATLSRYENGVILPSKSSTIKSMAFFLVTISPGIYFGKSV